MNRMETESAAVSFERKLSAELNHNASAKTCVATHDNRKVQVKECDGSGQMKSLELKHYVPPEERGVLGRMINKICKGAAIGGSFLASGYLGSYGLKLVYGLAEKQGENPYESADWFITSSAWCCVPVVALTLYAANKISKSVDRFFGYCEDTNLENRVKKQIALNASLCKDFEDRYFQVCELNKSN